MQMSVLKRRWLVRSALVGVTTAAILGGTAFAGTAGPSVLPGAGAVVTAQEAAPTAAKDTLMSRVATILGMDAAAVEAAAKQAHKQIMGEDLNTALDAAVAAGRVTQAQADAYYNWYVARPAGVTGLLGGKGRVLLHAVKMKNGTATVDRFATKMAAALGVTVEAFQAAVKQAEKQIADEALKAKLDAMVAAGRLTQAQADEYLQWLQARPEGVPGILPGIGDNGHGRGPALKFHFGRPDPGKPAPQQAPAPTNTSVNL